MELLQNLFAGDFAVAQSYFTAGTGQFVSAVIFFIIGLLLYYVWRRQVCRCVHNNF